MASLFTSIQCRMRHIIIKGASKIVKFPTPEVIAGENILEQLVSRIKSDQLEKILIVTDVNLHKLGLLNSLITFLEKSDIKYSIFDDVQPNPTIDNVENAANIYRNEKCQGIIAFGGGSPMDCAKVAGCRVIKPTTPVIKMRGMFKIMKPLPPLYAIPTTAGTGSETTAAAVISNPETHEKFAIIDMNIIPKVAVLDPTLMIGLPPFITATTGMDALTHAVEAYIGVHGTKFTDENAEKASKMIFENLEKAYLNGSDVEARTHMAFASFYAGLAFTRASVGYVHAIAHNLGGMYGVAHGLANAVVLPYVLEAFESSIYKKLGKLAIHCGIGTSEETPEVLSKKFIEKIKKMNQNMGIPTYIDALKIEDINLLAERATKEGNPAYPVPKIFNQKEMSEIIIKLLK